MQLDQALKAKTQGEILNLLKGTGKRLHAVGFKAKPQQKHIHIGAKAYRNVASLHWA